MNAVLNFTERSLHTAYYEADLGYSGYVILNLPIAEYKQMGCPHRLIFSLTPVGVKEQEEAIVA